jgi:hypothetical protein
MALVHDAVTVDVAMDVALVALGKDPLMPVGCLDVLLGCLQKINACLFEDDDDNPLTIPTALLSSMWRFITVDRSPSAFRRLDDILSTCRCHQGPAFLRNAPRSLHEVNSDNGEGLSQLGGLVSLISSCILVALREHSGVLSLYRRTVPTQAWPRTIGELLPYGPERPIHTLCIWSSVQRYKTMDTPGIVMCFLVKTYGSLFLRALLASGTPLFWINHTVRKWSYFLNENDTHRGDAERTMNAMNVLQEVALLVQDINNMMFDDEFVRWVSNDSFGRPITYVLDACSLAFRIADLPRMTLTPEELIAPMERAVTDISNAFSQLANRIVARIPHADSEGIFPSFPAYVHEAATERRSQQGDAHLRLYQGVTATQWKRRCYGPGCSENSFEYGRRFKACTGCNVARYCSRACQHAGWGHQGFAHRDVCDVLKMILVYHKTLDRKGVRDRNKAKLYSLVSTKTAATVAKKLDLLHESQFQHMSEYLSNPILQNLDAEYAIASELEGRKTPPLHTSDEDDIEDEDESEEVGSAHSSADEKKNQRLYNNRTASQHDGSDRNDCVAQ